MRYFVAVAEHMSFSRAADHMHISQSALSRHIQLIEDDMQFRLFDRIGRRIHLTPMGQELLAGCRSILEEVRALRVRTTEMAKGVRGLLRLGVTSQTLESLVARVLALYSERHSEVRVEIVEDGAARLNERVVSGEIHVAVGVTQEGSPLVSKALFPIAALAVVPASHPLSERTQLDVADLAFERLLLLRPEFMTRQLFDGACRIAQILPYKLIESSSPHCLTALVRAGHGIAIIPSTVLLKEPRLRLIPLLQNGQQLAMTLSIAWDPHRSVSRAAQNFIDLIQEFTSEEYPGKKFIASS